MAAEVVWADVVVGKVTKRLAIDDNFVEAIKIEPSSLTLVAEMKDGTTLSYLGCPYVLCTRDDGVPEPKVIAPDKEIVV